VSPTTGAAARPRPAVDVRGALALCGTLLKYLSASSLFPAAVALWYSESPWPFLAAGAIAAVAGFALERLGTPATNVGFREGYLVVSLTWLLAALYGALPYVFSRDPQLDRPLDALFESMSGFTTTGASILVDVEAVDQSLLMWRQFSSWIGGMGIIVLALAVLPRLRVGGRQLLESELPGPEMEMADRIRSTARRLWFLYLALTALLIVILVMFGVTGIDRRMGVFEAVSAAFGTMPLGGFMPDNRSFEGFAAASQWVVVVFMLLAGANFALTYGAIVRRRVRVALTDEELRLYLLVALGASAILVGVVSSEGVAGGEAAVRHGVFQAVSIMTTTGFATIDYATWPALGAMTIVALMFVGASAGSTSGSVKVVRHLLVGKVLRRELRQTVHPEEVVPISFNGRTVDERTLRAVIAFMLLYIGLFVAGAGVIAVDAAIQGPTLSTLDVISAAATTIGNVGPGFGQAGPMGSFAAYSDVSTVVMTVLMWLGRLEVIPLVVLTTWHYWRV
jgi:trk system potassium uptake protein TrkH